MWALYKEVQDYYEKGMRVPDDVTLLWSDDNWGNIRRLPTAGERARPGGAGVYYHFDYVGGPRSYKWLNTVPIAKVWEQMNLAWRYGATRIWIVNVGDIKPMEFPIQFFLDFAWDPGRFPAERLGDYTRSWAEREFGAEHAAEIAEIVTRYTTFNGRRKPEMLEPRTYSLVDYREAETSWPTTARWRTGPRRSTRRCPPAVKDAFYQLVLFPVKACAVVNELYVAAGRNRLYAVQGRASTNDLAERVRALFTEDARLTREYNETLAGGKWRHMMDQTHLGYTYWQQPLRNAMPAVQEIQVPAAGEMGVAIEGSEASWPNDPSGPAVLPALSVFDRQPRVRRGVQPRAAAVRVHGGDRQSLAGGRRRARQRRARPPDPGERAVGRRAGGDRARLAHDRRPGRHPGGGDGADSQPRRAAPRRTSTASSRPTATCRSRRSTGRARWPRRGASGRSFPTTAGHCQA